MRVLLNDKKIVARLREIKVKNNLFISFLNKFNISMHQIQNLSLENGKEVGSH